MNIINRTINVNNNNNEQSDNERKNAERIEREPIKTGHC